MLLNVKERKKEKKDCPTLTWKMWSSVQHWRDFPQSDATPGVINDLLTLTFMLFEAHVVEIMWRRYLHTYLTLLTYERDVVTTLQRSKATVQYSTVQSPGKCHDRARSREVATT